VPEPSAPWRSAAAQVLVEDLASPELDRESAHHLGRVLRLRPGAEVCATDGAGAWRRCRFDGAGAIEADGDVECHGAPAYPVTVAFALVKGDKPELVVQKLTELGVDRIVPFAARRSVVRWDDERAAKQLDRMRRVAREACAQSRRLWLPEVVMGGLGWLAGDGAVAADAGGRPLGRADRIVVVGPEGGWDDDELEVSGRSLDRVGLGDHVLRAETAAITAGVLLTTLRAGLVADSTT
jgi:16S rRNA (uracil1498-N3)-methyltransferase